MKFLVSKDTFLDHLQRAAAVSPKSTSQEVLKYVKVTASPDGLTFLGNNNEVAFLSRLTEDDGPLEVMAPGEALLNERVIRLCRELADESIEVSLEDGQLRIQGDGNSWQLQTQDTAEFPSLKQIESDPVIVGGGGLAKAITRTVFACDVQSTRYALGGVLFELKGDFLHLAATDSRRLSHHVLRVQVKQGVKDTDLIADQTVVPALALRNALALCSADEVEIRQDASAIQFSSAGGTLWCRLVEGRFPAFRDVIPNDYEMCVRAVAGPLARAIRQAKVVDQKESTGSDFHIEDGVIHIDQVGQDIGKSKIHLPVETHKMPDSVHGDGEGGGTLIANKPSMLVRIEGAYILDLCKTLDATALIEWTCMGSNMAQKFECDGTTYVVMPLSQE
ncbi:DNA polymerase III subunit beta [Thalassoglobus neptunius]|uniref:Beta sliding clamp n=1 Tax=Thalassoglobus neptunius TaxID=1938619 RepID=A0A5C5X872_9PLAN|nr:DNA polymerase III subunit beta [Thalassoglobus neptunius]TWT58909.1 DNA polymerase III subunit beta [Thalassoglobus neptunius]